MSEQSSEYIRGIIREEIERQILDEDYDSIQEIKVLANAVLKKIALRSLSSVKEYVQDYNNGNDLMIWFQNVSLNEVFDDDRAKYVKLRSFLEASSNTKVYMSNKAFMSAKMDSHTKGNYSYRLSKSKSFKRGLPREINLYYGQDFKNTLVEKVNEIVEGGQIVKVGRNLNASDLYFILYYPFISTLIHEIQHAYDDFRSDSKIYQTKEFDKFIKLNNELVVNKESVSKEEFYKRDVDYLNLNHEVWARFSQAMDKVRFTTGDILKNEKGESYWKDEMKDIHEVAKDFARTFDSFDVLPEDVKRKLMRKISQFWHIEQDKIKESNSNPKTLNEQTEGVLNYIYHGTYDGALNHIQKDGIKINAAKNNEPFISFTSDLNVANYYANAKGGSSRGVILRTLKTTNFTLSPKFNDNNGHEWITSKEIPPSKLEIKIGNNWVPIKNWDIISKRIIT